VHYVQLTILEGHVNVWPSASAAMHKVASVSVRDVQKVCGRVRGRLHPSLDITNKMCENITTSAQLK